MKRKRTTLPVKVKSKKINPLTKNHLTPKQELFCQYYISTVGNGTKSARLAGYKGNDNSLHVIACHNLLKVTIINRLRELNKEIFGEVLCDIKRRTKILSDFAVNNTIGEINNPDGSKKLIWQMSPERRMKAIDLLNKMEGIYGDEKDGETNIINIKKEIHLHVQNMDENTLRDFLNAMAGSNRNPSNKQLISVNS